MTLASLHMGLIADRFKKRQSIKDLTIKEIIESVGNNGQAFCRALLDGGTDEENFVGQTLLVLEFDGDLKYREFKEKCEKYSLSYAFTYKTLGSCANQKGFGAVFLMDRWIKNPALAKAANILLRAFFSPVGAECLNLGRYFLGGKGIIEKKPYAKINIVELARNLEIYYWETKGRNNSKELWTSRNSYHQKWYADRGKHRLKNNCSLLSMLQGNVSKFFQIDFLLNP